MANKLSGIESADSLPNEKQRLRRCFSAEDKARIVQEASQCHARGELAAFLRREHISHSHLTTWRRRLETAGSDGLTPKRPGPKPNDDVRDLLIEKQRRTISELERELSIVNALVELQKKASRILEMANPGIGGH